VSTYRLDVSERVAFLDRPIATVIDQISVLAAALRPARDEIDRQTYRR
jgi:hypothetical protein